MISGETIEQVKAAANIVEVVGEFVKLKKNGSNYEALCPFHNEKTASFKVSPVKQMYKCFGCGKSGDAISFLTEKEKLDFTGAIIWLANKYRISVDETRKVYDKPQPRVEKIRKEFIEFFEKRGISNNTLLRFKVTEAVEWMPIHEKEIPVVCFNYFRGEELVNIKFRGAKKTFKLAKNAELIFYNLNALEGEKTAIIVEGEIDCLTMHESGIYNAVSVPNGASKGNQRLEYLNNCWQYFEGKEKVIIAVDNDEPGHLLKEELGRRLGKERCYTVEYPEGCKDANDVLVKHGKEAVKQLVESCKLWPLEGIVSVQELDEQIVEYYTEGYPTGAKAHIPGFDELLSFAEGQMTVVTGIPGAGKDEFLNLIAIGLARFEQWKFGICGFEEPPAITVTKLQEKFTSKSFAFRKDTIYRMNEAEFINSFAFIKDNFYFINNEKVGAKLEDILDKASELVKRFGINAFIINPWNYLEHNIPNNYSETRYVSECMTLMVNFCMKFSVHLFLVAHPTKILKKKDSGKYEVPTLYSISGSAHFFNKTYNGICIYRDFETNIVDVYVQKVKWSWLGKLGFCSFNFDSLTRKYIPINYIGNEVGWKPLSILNGY